MGTKATGDAHVLPVGPCHLDTGGSLSKQVVPPLREEYLTVTVCLAWSFELRPQKGAENGIKVEEKGLSVKSKVC